MKKKLTEIFGMGDQSDGVPSRLPSGGRPFRKPTIPIDQDGATSRMARNADNDVTGRFARGSGPTLGSPQDEPLPDLPLEAGQQNDVELGAHLDRLWKGVVRDRTRKFGQKKVGGVTHPTGLPLEGEFDDLNRSLNGAQSVVRGNVSVREAFGMGAGDIKNQLSSAKDTYAAISKAIKMAGTGRDPVEVASALHDALYGEGSKPQPIKGGSEMGSSSSSMTSKAVGGLKLQ